MTLCLCHPFVPCKAANRGNTQIPMGRWGEQITGPTPTLPSHPKVLRLVFPQNVGRAFTRHRQNHQNPDRAPILSHNICRGACYYYYYYFGFWVFTNENQAAALDATPKVNILWHRRDKTVKPPDPETKPAERSDFLFFGCSTLLLPPPQHCISQHLIAKNQQARAAQSHPDVSATLIQAELSETVAASRQSDKRQWDMGSMRVSEADNLINTRARRGSFK